MSAPPRDAPSVKKGAVVPESVSSIRSDPTGHDHREGDLRLSVAVLTEFAHAAFCRVGVAEAAARQAVDVLLTADLRGIESHGLARLPSYIHRIQQGLIALDAELTTLRETPVSLAFDAGNGLGLVQGPAAMARCLAKAEASGLCFATVRQSNHFGIAGYYALMAARRQLCGLAMTNASPLVMPTHGAEARLGTNPIAFAAPTGDGPPLVVDMATSTVAWGKIEVARRAGAPLPRGWAVDAAGRPATDATAARWLMPLGGETATGGHKGYCLAVLVDVLCGPLAGAAWSAHVAGSRAAPAAADIGHTFVAWRIDLFREPAEFYRDLRAMLQELRATPPAPGHEAPGVLIPGDPELAAEAANRANGIPLRPALVDELRALADELGLAFPVADSNAT